MGWIVYGTRLRAVIPKNQVSYAFRLAFAIIKVATILKKSYSEYIRSHVFRRTETSDGLLKEVHDRRSLWQPFQPLSLTNSHNRTDHHFAPTQSARIVKSYGENNS